MCASALSQLKVKEIIFGCGNDKFGGCGSVLNILTEKDTFSDTHLEFMSRLDRMKMEKKSMECDLRERDERSAGVCEGVKADLGDEVVLMREGSHDSINSGPPSLSLPIASPLSQTTLVSSPVVIKGIFAHEAILLLRRFYLAENVKAPEPKKKTNRILNTQFTTSQVL